MIEFLLVVGVILFLLLDGINYSLAVFRKEMLVDAGRIAVREAATAPAALVTATSAPDSVLYIDPNVFDERATAIDITGLSQAAVDTLFNNLPSVHHALRGNMVVDTVSVPGTTLLRFRGTLLQTGLDAVDGYIVRVPDRSEGTISRLLRVIEPPEATALANEGVVRMRANLWVPFTASFGAKNVPVWNPGAVPPGFTVIDTGTLVPNVLKLTDTMAARKDIQPY